MCIISLLFSFMVSLFFTESRYINEFLNKLLLLLYLSVHISQHFYHELLYVYEFSCRGYSFEVNSQHKNFAWVCLGILQTSSLVIFGQFRPNVLETLLKTCMFDHHNQYLMCVHTPFLLRSVSMLVTGKTHSCSS